MKEKINKFGEKAFFAASNSGCGFYSFYGDIFGSPDISRRYIIKGGPGTGKSRFIREAGKYSESLGYETEYYYCSSDPTSLDGVIIEHPQKGRMCIIDGTAPHLCDMDIPGARDEIINLGAFWNAQRLTAVRDSIEKADREKKRAYRKAYECLRAVREISLTREEEAHAAIKSDKLTAAAQKFLRGVDASEIYFERIGLQSSFGMFGAYTLDTYSSVCESIVIVDDSLSIADAYLSAVLGHLKHFGISSYRSYDTQAPEKLDALYIPSMGLSFISDISGICASDGKCIKRINMQRFLDFDVQKRIKADMKAIDKVSCELREVAESEMEKAREAHFELESIYIGAMDFEAKEEFSLRWIEENL